MPRRFGIHAAAIASAPRERCPRHLRKSFAAVSKDCCRARFFVSGSSCCHALKSQRLREFLRYWVHQRARSCSIVDPSLLFRRRRQSFHFIFHCFDQCFFYLKVIHYCPAALFAVRMIRLLLIMQPDHEAQSANHLLQTASSQLHVRVILHRGLSD